MRKIIPTLTLACLALGAPTLAGAAPETVAPSVPGDKTAGPSAKATFVASEQAVSALVEAGAKDEALEAAVDQLLDYDWLAQAALGGPKKYQKRCADRCAEFKALLSKLIRRNYLKRISAKDNGTVIAIDEEIRVHRGRQVAKVNTLVSYTSLEDGRPMTQRVSYIMHRVGTQWQVRDMITEGLSLAKTWKHDFTELHKQGGMELVISRLRSKLGELDDLAKN